MPKTSNNNKTPQGKAPKPSGILQHTSAAKEIIVTITALVSLLVLIFGSGAFGTASPEVASTTNASTGITPAGKESIDFAKSMIIILSVSLATFIAYSIAKIYQSPGKFVNSIINQKNIYTIISGVSAGIATTLYLISNFGGSWSSLVTTGLLIGVLAGVILGILFVVPSNFIYKKVLVPFYIWTKRLDKYGKFAFIGFISFLVAIITTLFIDTSNDIYTTLYTVLKISDEWKHHDFVEKFLFIPLLIAIICCGFLYALIRLIHEAHKEFERQAKAEAKRKEAKKKAKAAAKKKAKAKKEAAKKAEAKKK